jgi:hypothetical protein
MQTHKEAYPWSLVSSRINRGLLSHRADRASFNLLVYDPRSAQDNEVLKNPFDDGVTLSLSMTVPTRL